MHFFLNITERYKKKKLTQISPPGVITVSHFGPPMVDVFADTLQTV